jgi:hypothetical protein
MGALWTTCMAIAAASVGVPLFLLGLALLVRIRLVARGCRKDQRRPPLWDYLIASAVAVAGGAMLWSALG